MPRSFFVSCLCACLSLGSAMFSAQAAAQPAPERLFVIFIDTRPTARLSAQTVTQMIASTLGVPVTQATANTKPSELGALSVAISVQGALLRWTLADGRVEVRRVSHGLTANAIVARIALAVSSMSMELAGPTFAQADLVNPYSPSARPRLPSPYVEASTARHRRRVHLDLVDAFDDSKRRYRRPVILDDTIDPWP